LFIGVVTDLAARRDKASAREIQRLKEQQLRLEERARLMANLHDGLGSQLASARLGLEHVTLDTERIRMLLDECLSDLHLVVDTMNNNDGSLADALRFLRHRVSARLSTMQPQIHWELDVDSVQGLGGELLLQLLRIVQEALTNALKHASARHIRIGASEDAGYLHLSVRDDGRGFSPEATKGQGLRNMHQRARRIGATLRVTGTPAGTRVELTLPLHGGGSDQEDSGAS
ncbi:MAG: sensor histidine kinase, partial [Steroidobacteraceae bacterium]